MQDDRLLEVRTRAEWRRWLAAHHDAERVVWLVFWKKHTGVQGLSFSDALDEALCYGWVDSLVRRIDDDRYAQKFTPRKAESAWSSENRRRYEDLRVRGLLAEPGLRRAPTARDGDAVRPSLDAPLPPALAARFDADPTARAGFERLPPSHRRAYLGWIVSAKKPETQVRRIDEMLRRIASGKRDVLV